MSPADNENHAGDTPPVGNEKLAVYPRGIFRHNKSEQIFICSLYFIQLCISLIGIIVIVLRKFRHVFIRLRGFFLIDFVDILIGNLVFVR